MNEVLSLKHYSIEEIKKEKMNLCPVCRIEAKPILTFRCVHCSAVHHFFECPKCEDVVIIPEDNVTIKVT